MNYLDTIDHFTDLPYILSEKRRAGTARKSYTTFSITRLRIYEFTVTCNVAEPFTQVLFSDWS